MNAKAAWLFETFALGYGGFRASGSSGSGIYALSALGNMQKTLNPVMLG